MELALMAAAIMLLGFFCQWLAWRLRMPAILFLLLMGLLLGPGLGFLDPDVMLGEWLFPFVSLGVAVILFEGSLTLRFDEVRGVTSVIRNLITIGVLITWLVMAAAAHFLAGLPWQIALLFGALVSVTGPTVIIPMLRSIRPKARIGNILRWEGILIDPIGAILAVLVFEAIMTEDQAEPLFAFFEVLMIGGILGALGAAALAIPLRKHWVPEYLHNFFALSVLLAVFSLSNHYVHESGLLAVTLMGVILANIKHLHVEEILDFKEHLTVLLISLLFILLAARLDFANFQTIGFVSIVLLAIAKFVVRPLSVVVSSIGSGLSWREQTLLSWISPRGIVAAAVASLFALKLEQNNVPGAELLVPLTFVMIIGTVVIESATSGWLANRLNLSAAGDDGVLILGANAVARAVAIGLKERGMRVLLADRDWESIVEAQLAGLDTYYGSLLSEHADIHLDLAGFTRLFAMTRNPEHNTLVTSRYRPEFGAANIFQLNPSNAVDQKEQENLTSGLQTRFLIGPDITWSKLASAIAKGAKVKSTKLTQDFGYQDYLQQYGRRVMPILATDKEHRLRVFSTADDSLQPGPGWTVTSLIRPGEDHVAPTAEASGDDEESVANKLPT